MKGFGDADYQNMYLTLFRAVTEALEQMEQQNYGSARSLLMTAQQQTEEIYISTDMT